MSGTLMEISAEFMRLHDMIVESEGELDEEAMAEIQLLLNKCDGKLNDKLDNYCALIRELEARAQIRTDEADRIRKRATMDRKASENLKRYLATGLEAMEMKSVDTPRFKITLGGTGGKQKLLLKEDQIPDKFWKDTVTSTVDKEQIRQLLDNGTELDFAEYESRRQIVRIM
tara:strand:+ start:3553 stop:4068 length:516 start_codon:yes stop_codon:yes gene_type:complete